jgi:hypothetical protein
MSKRSPRPKLYRWRISPIRGIGYVDAPDAGQAIQKAIKLYGITNPEQQSRRSASMLV